MSFPRLYARVLGLLRPVKWIAFALAVANVSLAALAKARFMTKSGSEHAAAG